MISCYSAMLLKDSLLKWCGVGPFLFSFRYNLYTIKFSNVKDRI